MARVVTVFGLSGVGKSWMISRYAAAANVAHMQASQLMRDARATLVAREVTSEDLRRGPVLDNQSLLTDAFAKVLATEEQPIIFDGHCLIDVGEQPIEIPVDVIRQLQPSGIVLVHSPAEEIVRRREGDTSRERPVRTADALAVQQDRCVAICTDYAEQLGIRFKEVRVGDEHGFAQSGANFSKHDARIPERHILSRQRTVPSAHRHFSRGADAPTRG
jgi:adenylate kinase